MTKKKINQKFILSIFSVVFALLMFLMLTFAWITIYEKAKINGIPIDTEDLEKKSIQCALYSWDNDINDWSAVTKDIKLQYIVPEQEYLFKLITTSKSDMAYKLKMSLTEYYSNMVYDGIEDDYLYVNRFDGIQYIPGYYYIDDDGNYVPEYPIEETMEIHVISSKIDDVESEVEEYYELNEAFLSDLVLPSGSTHELVFSIMFVSKENLDFDDGDNRYQFQSLTIKSIKIFAN